MCHLCEWVDEASELAAVRCKFCDRENLYCDECSSEIYIEDFDDYCCRECAVDRAALADETGKRVSVTTGRVIADAAVPSAKRLKFTLSSVVSEAKEEGEDEGQRTSNNTTVIVVNK